MIHSEHFITADRAYEVRHDNNGNAIHVYIRDKQAIVFPTLMAFIDYIHSGNNNVERFYLEEADLDTLYGYNEYSYYKLKKLWEDRA